MISIGSIRTLMDFPCNQFLSSTILPGNQNIGRGSGYFSNHPMTFFMGAERPINLGDLPFIPLSGYRCPFEGIFTWLLDSDNRTAVFMVAINFWLSHGFSTKSTAPSFRAVTASSISPKAVIITTERSGSNFRSS